MTMPVHFKKPARRNVEKKTSYTAYRDDLRKDFNFACGYCDDSDLNVDRICFHIDHFAPKKRFPNLETVYENLVYSCRFCNIRKSDHWVGNNPTIHSDGNKGFIDPCDQEYDEHLDRDPSGRIVAKSDLGRYIIRRLSLNLLRHELLWKARKARLLRNEIGPLLDRHKAAGLPKNDVYTVLLERFRDLTEKIEAYEFCAING